MASKNVETLKRAHQAFNDRKLDECAGNFTDGCLYRDLPRGMDFNGRDEFKDFMQGWITAFSDGRISDPKYIDAGDVVICEFHARGTNDGPLGTFSATRKRLDLPYCEITRFDAQGKIQQVTAYYDLLGMMSQLGHLQKPSDAQLGANP